MTELFIISNNDDDDDSTNVVISSTGRERDKIDRLDCINGDCCCCCSSYLLYVDNIYHPMKAMQIAMQ